MSTGLVLTDTFQGAYFLTRGLSLSLRAGEPYRISRSIAAEAAYTASRGVAATRPPCSAAQASAFARVRFQTVTS